MLVGQCLGDDRSSPLVVRLAVFALRIEEKSLVIIAYSISCTLTLDRSH